MTDKVIAYKGYDENLRCQGFQFEPGKEYEHAGPLKCCPFESEVKQGIGGFHVCKNPIDCFSYYQPGTSRYTTVEVEGETAKVENSQDSKESCRRIRVGAEIGLRGIIEASVRFIMDRVDWKKSTEIPAATTGYGANAATTGYGANAATTGDGANAATTGYGANAATTGDVANAATTGNRANAATTGYGANAATTGDGANAATTGYVANAATTGYGANAATTGDVANAATTGYGANAATTGNRANAATTGYGANAEVKGAEAVACCLGANGKARGALGCWIVLTERDEEGKILSVKSAKVDGSEIKANTWYSLIGGIFTEDKSDGK